MNVGDYVRVKDYQDIQHIIKIEKIIDNYTIFSKKGYWSTENIIKSSPNVIDLIREHDLLKLYDVEYGEEYIVEVVIDSANMLSVCNYDCDNFLHLVQELMTNEHIKLLSIVTKEQFESMQYKVGD